MSIDLAPLVALADAKTVPMHRHSWIYLLGGVALFLFGITNRVTLQIGVPPVDHTDAPGDTFGIGET